MPESANMAKYIALFGDDFAPIINALNNTLTPAVEAQILSIMDDLTLRAEIFGKEIQRTVTRLGKQGASVQAVKSALGNDMKTGGRLFSSLRNDIKEGTVEQINQSGRLGQMTEHKDANIFAWITVQGHKVCVDCSQRSGQTMTWSEWVSEGLPASGWSVCKGHCYCVLDPSGKITSPVTAPTHVVEKGASIKKPKIPWRDKFASQSKSANKAFQDTFQFANSKFKEFLTRLPQIQHITHGTHGAFHSTHELPRLFKLFDKKSRDYFFKHGGINMPRLSGGRTANTIRHEYGHFIHQNLHYQGFDRRTINLLVKRYRASKNNGNPAKFLKEETFYTRVIKDPNHPAFNFYKKVDGLIDLLKYDDAVVATKKRLGIGRSKAAKELLSKKIRWYKELQLKIRHGSLDEYIKYEEYAGRFHSKEVLKGLNKIPKDDKLLKALIKDKAEGVSGYLQDLLGALTKEKIGYGHGQSYYNTRGFVSGQHHEAFANLTCLYTHENPVYWNFIKKEMPELAKYFEGLIDDVVKKGYFGH